MALTETRRPGRGFARQRRLFGAEIACQTLGTSPGIIRCFHTSRRKAVTPAESRASMAIRQNQKIIETPTEARQAEPGPSVLALLSASTGLAILILGVIWFVFFRT